MRSALLYRPLCVVFGISAAILSFSPVGAQNQRGQANGAQQEVVRPALDLKARDIGSDRAAVAPQSLAIASLDVVVSIVGNMAQTTLTAQFSNPNDRVLEGDFIIDLPREAYVIGFALDVNGVMVDGVLQPKAKASEAYEQNLRRGVDPGLGEINAANQFRTRIFPIAARSGRSIKITYVSALNASNEYILPLTTAGKVGQVKLRVSNEGLARPTITLPTGLRETANTGSNTQAPQGGSGLTMSSYEGQDIALSGQLKLSNLGQAPDLAVSTSQSGDQYFSFSVPAAPISAAKPKTLAVYWDASRSRREDDLAKEIAFLERYIAQIQPERLDLVLFSDTTPRTIAFTRENLSTLASQLRAVVYQGASRFDRLETAIQTDTDLCLIFSDGQLTMDAFRITQWPCRVMTVSSSTNARRDILEGLASANRGSFIDLRVLSDAAGLIALQARGPDLRSLIDSSGRPVEFSISPTADGLYQVTGPKPDSGELTAKTYGADRRLSLANALAVRHNGAATFWGANLIKRLSATDNPDTDALLATVRRFGIATPDYSYIVLETVEDYATNNIAPSQSLGKAFLSQYQTRRTQIEETERTAKNARFDVILGKWAEQKAWWKTRFAAQGQGAQRTGNGNANGRGQTPRQEASNRRARLAGAPSPPPAPPPPPQSLNVARPMPAISAPTQAPSGALADAESVVVTGAAAASDASTRAQNQSQNYAGTPLSTITVSSANWNPNRPYIAALRNVQSADDAAFQSIYRRQEADFGDTPAFYFDMAEWAFRNGLASRAAAIARNALELANTSIDTKIILASRLERYGAIDQAIWLNERILQATPNKPQARRNLALSLAARADARPTRPNVPAPSSVADYERALALLMGIVLTPSSDDYNGIELIALMEANRLVPKLKALGVSDARLASLIDPRLTNLLNVEIRVTLEWNTDKTDMDLWVNEPSGEQAIYSNPRTAIGGRLSNDMTQGYGPEEYLLNKAPNGQYRVQANAFSADRLDPNGPTSLIVKLYRDWGRPTEKVESFVVELNRGRQQTVEVGRFVKGPQ